MKKFLSPLRYQIEYVWVFCANDINIFHKVRTLGLNLNITKHNIIWGRNIVIASHVAHA